MTSVGASENAVLAAIGAARSVPKRLNVRAGHAKVRLISDLTFMAVSVDPCAGHQASTMPGLETCRPLGMCVANPIQAEVADSIRAAGLPFHDAASPRYASAKSSR
ncbi:protein of unknown function (plasmid) [Caballeronia sp. S22]